MQHRFFKRLAKDQDGAVYLETAFIFIFLTIAFIGVLQIVDYVYVKQRTNKVADEMAALLSTIPEYKPADVQTLVNSATLMAEPEGVAVAVRFCQGGTGYESPAFGASSKGGKCGLFGAGGSDVSITASCSDATYNGGAYGTAFPRAQFVVVRSICGYKAGLRLFAFLADGPVTSTAITEMRNTIPEFKN